MPSNASSEPQRAALLRASSELEPVGVSEVLRSISNPRSRPSSGKSPTNNRPSASSSSGNGSGVPNGSSRSSGSGGGAMGRPRLSGTPSKAREAAVAARRPVSPARTPSAGAARPPSASRASRHSPSTERAREPLARSPSARSLEATGAGKKARPLPSTMKTARSKAAAKQSSPGTKDRSSTRVHSDEGRSASTKTPSGAAAAESAEAMEISSEDATDATATDDAAMPIELDEDTPPPPPEAESVDTTQPRKSPKTRGRNRSEEPAVLPDDVAASDEATQRLYLRFLLSENGDAKKAGKRFKETVAWRAEIDLATVYDKGNPQFWPIKCFVPHCFHGRDKAGRLVIYQRPALMNLAKLHEHGLDLMKFKAHYVWLEEYLAREVYATDSDSALKVIDLQGLKREHLTPDVRELLKISMRLGSHYPGRTHRLVLINKPFWASVLLLFINGTGLYSGTPMLSYTPKHTLNGLLDFVDATEIPADYGGQSPYNLGSAPDELSLYRAVNAVQSTLGEPVMNLQPDLIEHMSGWVPGGPSAIASDGSAPIP